MSRPAAVLLVLAALAPAPAVAQVWPGAPVVTAVASWLRPATPQWAFPPAAPQADPSQVPSQAQQPPTPAQPIRLDLRPALASDAPPPKVELRAKSEWLDDQGFSTKSTRVVYKRRF